ncbi:energy-coupling factor transport system ATP-binding protein [Methanococcoides vulcani]|uniref:Energy-coupling factor transport system ATP-binding protein n=1 Tax=Methanococcoides vulcani TaxID=1353158 RepID=A0A1H9Z3B5_9EURY|nr:ATP-binding cassette domain-containing protein [Methanococcoides vulcani]SES76034.1 energy-coupling factor transport system ATP-binding protein [Methanococcoides vulcani]
MSIDVKGLCFSYGKGKNEVQVLKDITFSIDSNESVGIVGKVGCGKTTLIKHLNGLLMPDSGNVTVDGLPSSKKEVCKKVGILFQHPSKQLFCSTVFEDIAYGPTNFGVRGDELDSCVHEAIREVGLAEEILERSPFTLSGGEMRLVALAGVLSSFPDYIVLDEPTSGLSSSGKANLFRILDSLKNNGVGIVLVSHQLEDVLDVVDRLIYLDNGKIAFEGTPSEYLASMPSPVPQVTELMRGLKRSGIDVKDDIFSVDHAFEEIYAAWSEKKGVL